MRLALAFTNSEHLGVLQSDTQGIDYITNTCLNISGRLEMR